MRTREVRRPQRPRHRRRQRWLGGHRSLRDQRGASSPEYALLITGIAIVVLAGILLVGGSVLDLFEDSCDRIRDASGAC